MLLLGSGREGCTEARLPSWTHVIDYSLSLGLFINENKFSAADTEVYTPAIKVLKFLVAGMFNILFAPEGSGRESSGVLKRSYFT